MSLAFDRQEFDARLARVREQMADQNLDVVLVFGQDQMFYLTGYDQIGYSYYQVLVVSRDDPRVVYLCREVDAHIIRETSVAEDIRVWYDDHRNDPTEFTAAIVREFVDITGCRIGMELQTHGLLPVFYARLAVHLAAASIVDASALLTDLRLEKSPAEVACMREAGTLFDIGMRAGFAAMHEGTRECDVHGAVMQSIYAAGGEFPAVAPPLESGPRTLHQTHGAALRRELKAHDPVNLEIGACFRRYHAVGVRSAAIGAPVAPCSSACTAFSEKRFRPVWRSPGPVWRRPMSPRRCTGYISSTASTDEPVTAATASVSAIRPRGLTTCASS